MARGAVVVGVLAVVVGSFLPWIVSGQTTRNSFTTVQVARRLGVVDSDLLSTALAVWYFVPLAAVVAVLLAFVDHRRATRLMQAIAVTLGLAVTAFGTLVLRAPIEATYGVAFSITAGLGTCAASLLSLLSLVVRPGGIESTDQ